MRQDFKGSDEDNRAGGDAAHVFRHGKIYTSKKHRGIRLCPLGIGPRENGEGLIDVSNQVSWIPLHLASREMRRFLV